MSTAKHLAKLANDSRVYGLVVQITDDVMEAIASLENFLNGDTFVEILLFLNKNTIQNPNVNKVLDYGFNNKKTILSSELLRFESKERIQMAVKALKASPSHIIEALTQQVITGSGKSVKDFQQFIDLNDCSLIDILSLIRRNMFADRDLLGLAIARAQLIYT